MITKKPSDSKTVLTDLVLPSETNSINTLFGGELLARMDRAASIAAQRHSEQIVVTASVNHVAFNHSIPIGSIVTIEAKVSRVFNTSMEVYLDVWYTDNNVKIPSLKPVSNQETKRYEGALRRRQLSLVLAGKIPANSATELKALFFK